MSKINDKLADIIISKLTESGLIKNDRRILSKLRSSKINCQDWRVLLEEPIYTRDQPKANINETK